MPQEMTDDASLGELFRRLTSDTTDLLRQEVELARAEVRETDERMAHAAVGIGVPMIARAMHQARAFTHELNTAPTHTDAASPSSPRP